MPARTLNIRGQGARNGYPDYVVEGLRVDRLGIYTGSTIRHFTVGETNQKIDPAWLLNAPAPWTIPFREATATVADGVCTITYNYEGLEADSFEFDEEKIVYELDTSMAEEPIETHPRFGELKKIYGWNQDDRRFAEFVAQTTADGNGLSGQKKAKSTSVMFGIDSYLAVGVIYRKSYAAKTVPGHIFVNIGAIIKNPPDIGQFRLPRETRKRNWIKLGPKVTRRGNASEVAEEYMLSGPKGWAEPVYGQGQLEAVS